MDNSSSHVESCWRTQLRNRIIQASSLLEILLSGLVLIGLLLSAVPLIKWMPGLLFDGNEVEIRIFLERSLDIVIGIEFIKMLAKHSPGSSLEVLLYAIARHLVVGHDSAVENLLSVGAIALIFIVRKFFFVPAFGAHLPDGHPAPDLSPRQSGIPADAGVSPYLGVYLAAIFAVLGHLYPLYFGFKGGKGVLVAAGAILAIQPVLLPFLAIIFLVCLIPTGMVSLGSVAMAALYPVLTIIYGSLQGYAAGDMLVCAIGSGFMSGMVIYMHRANIQRIREGKEYRFGKHNKK